MSSHIQMFKKKTTTVLKRLYGGPLSQQIRTTTLAELIWLSLIFSPLIFLLNALLYDTSPITRVMNLRFQRSSEL